MPISPDEMADALTIAETAKVLARSRRTVHRLIESGELGCVRTGSGRGRPAITRRQLTEYLSRHETKSAR